MNCAIIGCGRNTEDMIIPAIRGIKELAIEAVCDLDHDRAKGFADKYRIKRYFDNNSSFFDACHNVDFVIISTPGFTHFEICREALDHKLNILVEKPVTLELKDTLTLREMVDKAGVKMGVIQNYRYREPVIKAKEAQLNGIIGEVKQFNGVFHGQTLFNEPTPWSWRERENKTLLYEMMIHLLDLQVYFAGPVKRIIACHTKVDNILKTTTNIYALVEHENLAVGIVDFQLFSSSNYIGFEVFGTANDIKIKLQPHYLRIYSGTVNPLDEIYYDAKRIWDFGKLTLQDKLTFSKNPGRVIRKARSHYELFQRFFDSIRLNQPFPVDIHQIVPTMEYAQMLSDLVYAS